MPVVTAVLMASTESPDRRRKPCEVAVAGHEMRAVPDAPGAMRNRRSEESCTKTVTGVLRPGCQPERR